MNRSGKKFVGFLPIALVTYLSIKVDVHELSIAIIGRTHIFEWYVLRCESKKGHQKDIMCSTEIGQRAQIIMLTLEAQKST
jgi:hypothetical protein